MLRMDAIDLINFCIVAAGLAVAVLSFISILNIRYIESWQKKFLTIFFGMLFAYCLSDFLSQISLVLLGNHFVLLSRAAVFSESLFSSVLAPMLYMYLMHISGETRRSASFYAIVSLWGVYVILLIITQFTSFIYYFTPDNTYHRGRFYPLLLIPPVLLMLVNFAALYGRKERLSNGEVKLFSLYLLIPTVSMLIQMRFYGILIVVLGTVVSAMLLFIKTLNDQFIKEVRQATELSEQNVRIKALQMRPHFIYNTLSNIYYLCEIDPKKAQEAVDYFTTYLRRNFSAISGQGLIPFDDELEHVKAYLAVVKMRYEGKISVEYDTRYTSFHIPPLTVEPIVENAVKHGLDPDSDSFHIAIHTAREKDGIFITVENNGGDFLGEEDADAPGDQSSPRIGLANTAERLKALCDGTLSIAGRAGGGSIVTISLHRF